MFLREHQLLVNDDAWIIGKARTAGVEDYATLGVRD